MLHSCRKKLASFTAGCILSAAICPAMAGRNSINPDSLSIAYPQYLWPKVGGVATVYYAIDKGSDPNATPNIDAAIGIFNADFKNDVQWVPWQPALGPNFVDINLNAANLNGICEADVGYQAVPAQPMAGAANCTIGTLLHEMGHVIGLWHEQTRSDRDEYVVVDYGNVIKGSWGNFEIRSDDEQILSPYDYASVMQYISPAFSRNGGPVIETIPAGIPLAGYEGVPAHAAAKGSPAQPTFDYSAGDKETIRRLYGAAPTEVTVTSNPVGLDVIVDGKTVKTPQTYTWTLESTHTLDVATSAQQLAGVILDSDPPVKANFHYTFGRWSDNGAESHTITVASGSGSPMFPASAPQVATYAANFIQLVPYAAVVAPSGAGSIAVSPAPRAYSGAAGKFLVARQQVTLTASAAAGWSFYEFLNAPFWLPGGLGANPKTFYVPDSGNPAAVTVEFSDSPVYLVDVRPAGFSSGLYVTVDAVSFPVPKRFSSRYDHAWVAKSSHTLGVPALNAPASVNTRYAFAHWSDGGAIVHSIASLPAVATNYVATVTPEYRPATTVDFAPCGGSSSIAPASPTHDGFYPAGRSLSFSATPDSGWTFAGWSYDVTGNANPASLTADDETLVVANFNTTSTPLTLAKLSPSSAAAGGPGLVLTLTGTGFTPSSLVAANGTYRTVHFIDAETLTVPLRAADFATPGGFQVFVENFPSGWNGCAVFGDQTFLVGGTAAR